MQQPSFSLDASTRARPAADAGTAPTLICFSHLRWNFVFQRPQHLLTRAASEYRVIFVEEPVHADHGLPRLDLREESCGVTVAVPVLPRGLGGDALEALQGQLLDELLDARAARPWVFWYYTPMALGFSGHLQPDVCVYDCMDELSAFRFAPPELAARELDLFARADLVFTGGQSLYEAKRARHSSVRAFPSSIDAPHFARARRPFAGELADQAGMPHPRLGYFGVIDERIDLDLIATIADFRPLWQFVMIGPVVKIAEADLPRRPNIHWLGCKTYDELPEYLAGWDVGLMPFAINESTRYISPTKTPEFLAAGVPVVSTPVPDVIRAYGSTGLVEIAADAEEMVSQAEMLLGRPREAWLEKVDRALGNTSWDRTWAEMSALITRQLETVALQEVSLTRRLAAVHV